MRRCLLLLAVVITGETTWGQAYWPQWRGPALNGTSPAKALPTRWSEKEHVIWKVPLPAWGGATPIVWGDRVFIVSPSESPETKDNPKIARRFPFGGRQQPGGPDIVLICMRTTDGSVLWRTTLATGNKLYGKQNMASPSPVTDGRHVWAVTGTGVVTALDFKGKITWRRDLQKDHGAFGLYWGYASSPLLYDGKIIVEVLHGATTDEESYVIAFDAETGKTLWDRKRVTDAAEECPDAYTTPTLLTHDGTTQIIISGADYVTAHDPRTGAEIWRAGGLNPQKIGNYRIVASPVAVGGMVYAPTRVKPLLAIRAGGRGDVTTSHLAWKFETIGGPDVPTPVCDGRRLYLANDRGIATCLDARSGRVVWGPQRTTIGTVSASPVLADGKLYVTNESAVTTVLAAGAEFKKLATNELDDGYTIASIAVAHSRLFMRTSSHLYCIGR